MNPLLGLIPLALGMGLPLSSFFRKKILDERRYTVKGMDRLIKESYILRSTTRGIMYSEELYPSYYNNPFILNNLEEAIKKNKAIFDIYFNSNSEIDNKDLIKLISNYPQHFKFKRLEEGVNRNFKRISLTNGKDVYFLSLPKDERSLISIHNSSYRDKNIESIIANYCMMVENLSKQ